MLKIKNSMLRQLRYSMNFNSLPDFNPENFARSSRWSEFNVIPFGGAKLHCSEIASQALKSDKGVESLIGEVYELDALSTYNAVFIYFVRLLNIRRSVNEKFPMIRLGSVLLLRNPIRTEMQL